jgi:hypothetical protein
MTQHDLNIIHLELEMQVVAAEAQSRRKGRGNKRNGAIIVKVLKVDRSMSLTVFHQTFEATADHNSWGAQEATHLLAILPSKCQS